MTRHIRTAALLTFLTLGASLLLPADSAMAQGPYGRNSYEDWPFNQGSLFYRPLKPKPRPKVKVQTAPRLVYPNAPVYTYPQPRYYTYPQGGYYYYPATPGYAQPVVPR